MTNKAVRFMIVDALAGVQTYARQLLESHGFEPQSICCAHTTAAALEQSLSFQPDFLLADWFGKAALTGLALHQRLREINPNCEFALLSFELNDELQAAAKAAGARFVMGKPFTALQLKAQMDRVLHELGYLPLQQPLAQPMPARVQPAKPAPRVLPPIPVVPTLKVGDRVRWSGKDYTVECVLVRQGEMAAQLKGLATFVAAGKLQRL